MGNYKTTKKDLAKFKVYFKNMQSKFGLLGWEIDFKKINIGDSAADLKIWLEARHIVVTLCSYFAKPLTDEDIKKHAEHECLELLFARYEFIASSRFSTESELNEARHEIIQILQPILTMENKD
jgi:arsenate reductase-like glutaredoxin family protein